MENHKSESKEKFKFRLNENLSDQRTMVALDDLDRAILEMHMDDVFFSYNDLAEKWKVTSATIRNRIKRLKALGVMDVILVMNPFKLGYTTFALIGIRIHPGGDFKEIAHTLLAMDGVTFVMMVTGRYDFFIQYVCRNTEEFQHFLVDTLRKIPGIASIESFTGLELYERKFELGVIGTS